MKQNYITKCASVVEELKWDNFIPPNATRLIIGTFPTIPKRRCFQFFYPNKDNPFWDVLASIAEVDLVNADAPDAIENRKIILAKLNLGITDMGKKILRHANSSLDQSILPVEFMDIFQILDDNPTIQKLILTSSSGENSVDGWLSNYCKLNSVKYKRLKGRNPKRGTLNHKGKEIKIVSVHSTSRAATKTLEVLIEMYREELHHF